MKDAGCRMQDAGCRMKRVADHGIFSAFIFLSDVISL